MSARTFLDELVVRVRLALSQPTLLLLVFEENEDLTRRCADLAGLLSSQHLAVRVLEEQSGDDGPARWVQAMASAATGVCLHVFSPAGQLAMRAAARALNAQREELRGLSGPLLLIVSERTERELRQYAPDFFWFFRH